MPEFLQQKLKPKKGKIIQIASDVAMYQNKKEDFTDLRNEALAHAQKYAYEAHQGKEVGEHDGAHFFTKGQRKGLAVGGTKEPLFVIETDVNENIIYAGEGKNHLACIEKHCL